jgi:hypothetical protein
MEEDDGLDRYPPTVRYLQKLGPTELDLILETSKWIFKEDPKMGLQVSWLLVLVEIWQLIFRYSQRMNLKWMLYLGKTL